MAAKKRTKPKDDQEQAASPKEAKPAEAASGESGVLDLIDPPKKKRVRKKAAKKVAAKKVGAKAPEPEPEPEPDKETLADRKKAALNLFEEVEKKAAAKKTRAEKPKDGGPVAKKKVAKKTASMLPPISAIKAEKEKVLAPAKPVAPEPEVQDVDEEEEADADLKIINIKPPIIVKDLAERMGLKPFKLIAELMKLEVFVSANKSIEGEARKGQRCPQGRGSRRRARSSERGRAGAGGT